MDYLIEFNVIEVSSSGRQRKVVERLWLDDLSHLYNLLENEKFQEKMIELGVLNEEK